MTELKTQNQELEAIATTCNEQLVQQKLQYIQECQDMSDILREQYENDYEEKLAKLNQFYEEKMIRMNNINDVEKTSLQNENRQLHEKLSVSLEEKSALIRELRTTQTKHKKEKGSLKKQYKLMESKVKELEKVLFTIIYYVMCGKIKYIK